MKGELDTTSSGDVVVLTVPSVHLTSRQALMIHQCRILCISSPCKELHYRKRIHMSTCQKEEEIQTQPHSKPEAMFGSGGCQMPGCSKAAI
jgi:hypothetical protein